MKHIETIWKPTKHDRTAEQRHPMAFQAPAKRLSNPKALIDRTLGNAAARPWLLQMGAHLMLRNEFQSCTVKMYSKCIDKWLVLQVISSRADAPCGEHRSISLSCPAAKTRITDLVSGKVQQVQRPRWHQMAPSSGGVLTELGAFCGSLICVDVAICGWWMVDDHQDPQVSAKLLTKALKYPRALKQNVRLKDLLSPLSNLGYLGRSGAPWPRSQRRSRWCGCVSNRDLVDFPETWVISHVPMFHITQPWSVYGL